MNATHFLNIDLELESKEDIALLVEELSSRLTQLTYHECNGLYRASFEGHQSEAEEIVAEYVSAFISLSEASKQLWETCVKKQFSFGFQAGAGPRGFEKSVSVDSLKKIASVNGQLGITIYSAGCAGA